MKRVISFRVISFSYHSRVFKQRNKILILIHGILMECSDIAFSAAILVSWHKGLSTQNCFITKQTVSRASNKPQRKAIRCSYIRLMREKNLSGIDDHLFKKQGFWKLVKYFCVVFGVTKALSYSLYSIVLSFFVVNL